MFQPRTRFQWFPAPQVRGVSPACWLVGMLALLLVEGSQAGPAAQPERDATEQKLRAAWGDLGGSDARAAFAGLKLLRAAPQRAVPFLDEHLVNPPVPDLAKIKDLIADLDDEDYSVRALAQHELAKMGMSARPVLEQALTEAPSAEAHKRLKKLLNKLKLTALSPRQVQVWRGIEALESIGTPEAQKVLERLAEGFPGHWQTRQAKEALQRLKADTPRFELAKEIKEPIVLTGHTSRVHGLAFSPDGKLLASVSLDRTARLWDPGTGKLLATLPHPTTVYSVVFTPDSRRLVTGCVDGALRVWDAAKHKQLFSISGSNSSTQCLAASPDGRFLASSTTDNKVRLWEAETGRLFATLSGHKSSVMAVAFTPDSRTIVSGASDCTLKAWEVITGQERATISGLKGLIRGADLNHDGGKIVAVESTNDAHVWDLFSGKELLAVKTHTSTVRGMCCNPVLDLFATIGSDATCRLWHTATGKELATLRGHSGSVRSVTFSADGRLLATGGYDKSIRIWKLSNP